MKRLQYFSIVLVALVVVSPVQPDNVDTVSVEFNKKTLKPNTIIYELKQSDLFKPPYYIIPIAPNQLTQDLNIDLNTGKIFLQNVPNEADQFKYSVLSIMHGTAKMLILSFVDADLASHTTSPTTLDTKSTIVTQTFVSTEHDQATTPKPHTIDQYDIQYYYISKSKLKKNLNFGRIGSIPGLNLSPNDIEYNLKTLISIDMSTGKLYLIDYDMLLTNLPYLIEISLKQTRKIFVHLTICNECDGLDVDEELLVNVNANRLFDATTTFSFGLFAERTDNVNVKYFISNRKTLNQLQNQDETSTFEIKQSTGQVKIKKNLDIADYQLVVVALEFDGISVKATKKRINMKITVNNNRTNGAAIDYSFTLSDITFNLPRTYEQNRELIDLRNYFDQMSVKYTRINAHMASVLDTVFYYDPEDFKMFRINYDEPDRWPPINITLGLYNVSFNELNDLDKQFVYSQWNLRLNVNWQSTSNTRLDVIRKFRKRLYELTVSDQTRIDTVVFEFAKEIEWSANMYNCEFEWVPLDAIETNVQVDSHNGNLVLTDNRFDKFTSYHQVRFRYYADGGVLSWDQALVRIDIRETNRFRPEFETDSPIRHVVRTGGDDQHGLVIVKQIVVHDNDSTTINNRLLNFTLTDLSADRFDKFFAFNSTNGIISLIDGQSMESDRSYAFDVNITAYDTGTPCLFATKAFQIILTSQQDPAIVTANAIKQQPRFKRKHFNATITENVRTGTRLTIPSDTHTSLTLTSLLSTVTIGPNLAYKVNMIDPTSTFQITDQVYISNNASLDRELTGNYTLFLYLTTDLSLDTGTNVLYDSAIVFVNVLDVNDNRPVFHYNTSNVVNVDLYEDQAVNYTFNLICSDSDLGDNARLTYELFEDYDGRFVIDAQRGRLRIARRLMFDDMSAYHLIVVVRDNGVSTRLDTQIQVNVQLKKSTIGVIPFGFDKTHVDLTIDDNCCPMLYDELFVAKVGVDHGNKQIELTNANYSLVEYDVQLVDRPDAGYRIFLLFRIDTATGHVYAKLLPVLTDNAAETILVNASGLVVDLHALVTYTDPYSGRLLSTQANMTLGVHVLKTIKPTSNADNSRPFVYANQYVTQVDEGLQVNSFVININVYDNSSRIALGDKWFVWFNVLGGNVDNSFSLDYNNNNDDDTGIMRARLVTNQILNSETRSSYKLKIGVFMKRGETYVQQQVHVYIRVIDWNNNVPGFRLDATTSDTSTINTKTVWIDECLMIGSMVTRIEAYDIDRHDRITYAIVRDDDDDEDDFFSIDRVSGVLQSTKSLDYETKSVHVLHIQIFDGQFNNSMRLVVNLIDNNDNLVLASDLDSYETYVTATHTEWKPPGFVDHDSTDFNSFVDLIDSNSRQTIVNISQVTKMTNDGLAVTVVEARNRVDFIASLRGYRSFTVIYTIPNGMPTRHTAPVDFKYKSYVFDVHDDRSTGRMGSLIGMISMNTTTTNWNELRFDHDFNGTFYVSSQCQQSMTSLADQCCCLILIGYMMSDSYEFKLKAYDRTMRRSPIETSVKINVLKTIESAQVAVYLDSKFDFATRAIFSTTNGTVMRLVQPNDQSVFVVNGNNVLLNQTGLLKRLGHTTFHPFNLTFDETTLLAKNINHTTMLVLTCRIQVDYSFHQVQSNHIQSNNLLLRNHLASIMYRYRFELPENTIESNIVDLRVLTPDLAKYYDVFYEIYQEPYKSLYSISDTGRLANRIEFDYELLSGYEINLNDSLNVLTSRKHAFSVQVWIRSRVEHVQFEQFFIGIECFVVDVDEYRPEFVRPDLGVFWANASVGSVIDQFNTVDYDGGMCGRIYCHLTQPSGYFQLNALTGQLRLAKSFNTTRSMLLADAVYNYEILSHDQIKMLVDVECNSSLHGSMANRKSLAVTVDFACSTCVRPRELHALNIDHRTNFNLIVLITVSILITLIIVVVLMVILIKVKLNLNNKNQQQTSQSSLFRNSSNVSSTYSNGSMQRPAGQCSTSANHTDTTLTSRSTALTTAFMDNSDTFRIFGLDSCLADNTALNNYLCRLGIDVSVQQPQQVANDKHNHFYHDFSDFQAGRKSIDGVLLDLGNLIGTNNIQNTIDMDLVKRLLTNNVNNSQNNTSSSTVSDFNSLIESNNILNDDLSFIKWNNLLDWTPQYSAFSDVFDDLSRLNNTANDKSPDYYSNI